MSANGQRRRDTFDDDRACPDLPEQLPGAGTLPRSTIRILGRRGPMPSA